MQNYNPKIKNSENRPFRAKKGEEMEEKIRLI
jgi:hypothetical protein